MSQELIAILDLSLLCNRDVMGWPQCVVCSTQRLRCSSGGFLREGRTRCGAALRLDWRVLDSNMLANRFTWATLFGGSIYIPNCRANTIGHSRPTFPFHCQRIRNGCNCRCIT